MKLETKRVALTGGVVWAAALFLTTLISIWTGLFTDFLRTISSIYPGYSVTYVGSVVGIVYGFLDVFIGVYIFAWVYKRVGK
jgi:hypothetical protein